MGRMDYEACLEAFYRQLPLDGASVIDVGAHVGRHAIPLAQLVGREGTVHAFEPIPYIRDLLIQNLNSAGIGNVILYPFALTSEPAPIQFHYVPNLAGQSGIKARHSYDQPPAEPELLDLYARRLDDVIPNANVDFIKIDIEGGELDMLKGAVRILQTARPLVSFECGAAAFLGYHDRPQEIFSLFHGRGYAVYSILGARVPDEKAFIEASYAQNFWDYVAFPYEKVDMARFLLSQ